MHWVVVRGDAAIRLREEGRRIRPSRGGQLNRVAGTVSTRCQRISTLERSQFSRQSDVQYLQHLVDRLTLAGLGRDAASIRRCALFGVDASLDQLHPRVREAGVDEKADAARCVGVAIVGVAAENDGATGRVGVHVGDDLLNAGATSIAVACVGAFAPKSA